MVQINLHYSRTKCHIDCQNLVNKHFTPGWLSFREGTRKQKSHFKRESFSRKIMDSKVLREGDRGYMIAPMRG